MARTNGRTDEDFAEEIRAHLQLETDRLVAEGMDPGAARLAAERSFGNVVRVQERFYESRRWMWLDHLQQDVRDAVRGIARYPVAFAIAVLSLGAGIGAATSTLVIRNAVFLAPPPLYASPNALSSIDVSTPQQARGRVPAGLYRRWLEDPQLREGLGARQRTVQRDIRVAGSTASANVHAVTPSLFEILGVGPALGAGFDEWPADRQAPAMLSHAAWQRLLGGSADVIGLPIWIDDQPHTIIGVMPERFWFASMDGPVWTRLDVATVGTDTPLDVVLRRAPGLSPTALVEYLRHSTDDYAAAQPAGARELRARVDTIGGTPLGRAVGPVVILLLTSAVVLTLLIACTNVAVLLMAQWTMREHEIAIRASLGSSRGRIVRSLLAESILIAVAGGLLGVCVTLALRGLAVRDISSARLYDLSIDPVMWLQCGLMTLAAGVLTGVAPALYETRRLHASPLQAIRGSDRVRQRWRHALVVVEITTTVALLVVTGAMLSSYYRTLTGERGFDTHPLLRARVEVSQQAAVNRILDRLRDIPGVVGAEAATAVPYFGPGPQVEVAKEAGGDRLLQAERVAVGPRYFTTLGVPLRAGRSFDSRDVAGAPPVIVVNDVLAAQLWPGDSPLGHVVWISGASYQVVGVTAGYANSNLREPRPAVFVPLAQDPERPPDLAFLVRAAGDPAALAQVVRREIAGLGEGTVASVTTIDQIIGVMAAELLIGTYPLAPLILTGLLLTSAGIYGVLAFAVTRRETELAVRVAIGATRADLVRLVGAHSVRLLGLGIVIGLGATFALTRIAQGRGGIFDSPGWQAFVIPTVIVIAIGAVATWIPMRRALAIEPARLLRTT